VPLFSDAGAIVRSMEAGIDAALRAEADGERFGFERSDLRLPVLAPRAVICVGLNYRSHILEMGRELPQDPTLFAKLPRALTAPYADIDLPSVSSQVDYEGELVVVVGKGGRNITVADAGEHIGGYTVMNDVSMRDFQYRSLQWFAGKNFDSSTPVGPWIVTADEIPEVAYAELHVAVNGETRQRATLDDLLFWPHRLISDISHITELQPGDLIATGTPGGVGWGMEPKCFLEDGDVVEVTISGIGTIRNVFREQ
jgi:acylpyruvate hydrolase